MNITEDYIASLAPNASAVTNGKKISKTGGFVSLHKSPDSTLYYGECSGSGKSLYSTSVDFIDEASPVCRCSCPSRQIPCKHAIGLLFEILSGKTFEEGEVPEDIAKKREKKANAEEKKKERESKPSKPNKTTAVNKMKKQLEGLEIVEKFVDEVITRGISSVMGTGLATYRELAKDLGNYYLIEPQNIILNILYTMKKGTKEPEKTNELVLKDIIKLHSIVKKGKEFLKDKIEKKELPAEDDALLEMIGFTWKLAQLKELGLYRENAELVQLSFDVSYIESRSEFLDEGIWIDLQTGEISKTENHRPLRAMNYIKEEDSFFDVACVPELCIYPGDSNRRVRWDKFVPRNLTKDDIMKIIDFASTDIQAVIKNVKNCIKNPLSTDSVVSLVRYDKFVKDDKNVYIVCGDTYIATDISENMLKKIPSAKCAVTELYIQDGKICANVLSVVTDKNIIRLKY